MPFQDMMSVVVTFHIHGARGLPDRERFGKNDPFVRIKCAAMKKKTNTVNNGGTDPVWKNQALKWVLGDRAMFDRQNVVIKVFNDNKFSDSLLGKCRMRAEDLVALVGENTRSELPLVDKDGEPAGFLDMTLEIYDPVAMREREAEEAEAKAEAEAAAAEARAAEEEAARAAEEEALRLAEALAAAEAEAEAEAIEAAKAAAEEARLAQLEAERIAAESAIREKARLAALEAQRIERERVAAEAERLAELAAAQAERRAAAKEDTAFKTSYFEETVEFDGNAPATATASVPEGYKLVGGGCATTYERAGVLVTESYPSSQTEWTVTAQPYKRGSEASSVTAYAIGIFDPEDVLENLIVCNFSEEEAGHPTCEADLPEGEGFVLTGVGAQAKMPEFEDVDTAAQLLVVVAPKVDLSGVRVRSKDHMTVCKSVVGAYAIGLRSKDDTIAFESHMEYITGAVQAHPECTISDELDEGELGNTFTCGGLDVYDEGAKPGQYATHMQPLPADGAEPNEHGGTAIGGFFLKSKDHMIPAPASITGFAISLVRITEDELALRAAKELDIEPVVFSETREVGPGRETVSISVPAGYKMISGGCHQEGERLVVESHPSGKSTWTVTSRDYQAEAAGNLTVYAVAVHDPFDFFTVAHAQNWAEEVEGHSHQVAELPEGFVLTGGGFGTNHNRILKDVNTPGSFGARCGPTEEGNGIRATSKDHLIANMSRCGAYAIGIRSNTDREIEGRVFSTETEESGEPGATVESEDDFVIVGGGLDAYDGGYQAQYICCSKPVVDEEAEADGAGALPFSGWHSQSRQHRSTCVRSINVYGYGIKLAPAV